MPDTLSLSASVSFGLLAGIVSGVCYLVANGLTWQRSESQRRQRCINSSRDDDGVCLRCGGDKQGGVVPCICFSQSSVKFESGAWFLRQVQRASSLMPWSISTEKLEQIDEEGDGRESPGPSDTTRRELQNIKEFLETISAKLAGGPLEGTRVAPLYDHPAYLPPRNASPLNAPTSRRIGASGAHVQLKRLVARIIEEASALPALARYATEPSSHTPTIESSTYEDLLATAILNKVIERYQNENGSGGRSSGIHSASASPTPSERSSPRSINSRHTRDITPPLHEEDDVSDWDEGEATDEALEVPRRVPFPEFGGDVVHHTLTVTNEDREFDEVSGSDLQALDGTWEENWLFQKKKIKTVQSVPVPMLVPNSNTEYRALIGDRDADDTTDLSDNASDADEEITEYKSDIKRVLDSKHVIGGKPKVDDTSDFEPDSLTIIDGPDDFEKLVGDEYKQNEKAVNDIIDELNDNNITVTETINLNTTDEGDDRKDSILVFGIDSGPLPKAEFALNEEIHRTVLNGNVLNVNGYTLNGKEHTEYSAADEESDFDLDSLSSKKGFGTKNLHENEGEYEETVAVPVQRHVDSLRRQHFEDSPRQISIHYTDQEEDLIPGSIAYRERKKWLNYVDMPNNPYSPEAIQKRLSTKNTSSIFDTITKKSKGLNDDSIQKCEDVTDRYNHIETPVREVRHSNLSLTLSTESINKIDDRRSQSPSPRILKEVLADEIPQYKRYGRDYYIREAKASAGGRKKSSFSDTSSTISSMNKSTSLDNFDREFASPGLLIKQFKNIATNQQYTKFAGKDTQIQSMTTTCKTNDNNNILIEYEDANEQLLFSAKPAIVDDDTDKRFEEILQSAYKTDFDNGIDKNDEPLKSPISVDNSYVSSSSMEDSIKIYNVQTGEIMKCKPDDSLSVRYEPDGSDNVDSEDKRVSEGTVDTFSPIDDANEQALIENGEEKLVFSELDDVLPHLPKVKELAKKFISMENLNEPVKVPQPYSKHRRSKDNILNDTLMERSTNKHMYMHSLTARSISKEFREELKLSMATPLTVPGGSKEIPDGIEEVTKESSRPGSPLPEPGTIKTKLAFFESLKTKFSNK